MGGTAHAPCTPKRKEPKSQSLSATNRPDREGLGLGDVAAVAADEGGVPRERRVLDTVTGLLWLKEANCRSCMTVSCPPEDVS